MRHSELNQLDDSGEFFVYLAKLIIIAGICIIVVGLAVLIIAAIMHGTGL